MENQRQIYVKHIKRALNEHNYKERELRLIKDVVFGLLTGEEQLKRQVELTGDIFFDNETKKEENNKGGKE